MSLGSEIGGKSQNITIIIFRFLSFKVKFLMRLILFNFNKYMDDNFAEHTENGEKAISQINSAKSKDDFIKWMENSQFR